MSKEHIVDLASLIKEALDSDGPKTAPYHGPLGGMFTTVMSEQKIGTVPKHLRGLYDLMCSNVVFNSLIMNLFLISLQEYVHISDETCDIMIKSDWSVYALFDMTSSEDENFYMFTQYHQFDDIVN